MFILNEKKIFLYEGKLKFSLYNLGKNLFIKIKAKRFSFKCPEISFLRLKVLLLVCNTGINIPRTENCGNINRLAYIVIKALQILSQSTLIFMNFRGSNVKNRHYTPVFCIVRFIYVFSVVQLEEELMSFTLLKQ